MQAVSVLPVSRAFSDSYSSSNPEVAEISGNFPGDLMAKLKIDDGSFENEVVEEEEEKEKEEEEEEEEEFSFACTNPEGSSISADDVFDNGQIRPMFPIFNRDLLFSDGYDGSSPLRPPLRKVFVEQHGHFSSMSSESESDELEGAPEGPYCEWSGKMAVEASSAKCKKSNSTGFSKLWRFRDAKIRSNSDGKDAFVFLNSPATRSTAKPSISGMDAEKAVTVKAKAEKTNSGGAQKGVVKKDEAGKSKTTSSAHEKHYVLNRAKKESDRRKSYLPYRQDLVGIFANVNGLSRNVHPF